MALALSEIGCRVLVAKGHRFEAFVSSAINDVRQIGWPCIIWTDLIYSEEMNF
jgi:hypothetical protein